MDITKALVYALAEMAIENKDLQNKNKELENDNYNLSLKRFELEKELEALKCKN